MVYFMGTFLSILLSFFIPKQRKSELRKKEKKISKHKLIINKNNAKRDIFCVLSTLPLIIISIFRYGIGTDYFFTYIPQFKLIAGGERGYYEIGFYYLNKIVAYFTRDGQWLIAITAIITLIFVFLSIFKESKSYALSIFLFVWTYNYFISLNNIRQSLASSILLLAIYALIKKKRIFSIILTIVAGLIHQVAFAFLIVIILSILNLSAFFYIFLAILVFMVGKFVAPKLLPILIAHIPRLSIYFGNSVFARYNGIGLGLSYTLVHFIILTILAYLELSKKHAITGNADLAEFDIAKICQFLILCISAISSFIPAAYRIARIFSFFDFILIPDAILNNGKDKTTKILLICIVILLYGYLFINNCINGIEEVFPYVSIFNK